MRYLFNGMVFDGERFELTSAGKIVSLRPRALRLLQYLLENRHRLVGKEELVQQVWQGRVISDSAITVTIRSLRAAIGREMVETIYGQGVKLSGAVALSPPDRPVPAVAADMPETEDFTGGRPSVAVLPFRVLGANSPNAFLAEALADDILTALSKLRWLFVIARGSSFQFPSFAYTPAEIGERLNARYCLSGSLEFGAREVRISAEIAHTVTGEALWRDDYSAPLEGIHEIRQEIVRKVAAEADARISASEVERARLKAPDSVNAWEHFHLGLSRVLSVDMRRHGEARSHFQSALALEPDFARAHAGLANADFLRAFLREDPTGEGTLQARRIARRAVELDPLDPYCNLMLARMDLLQGDRAEGLERLRRTIELSPSYSVAYSDLARILVMVGHVPAARESLSMALALNPADPYNHTSFITLTLIELSEGHFAEAAQVARKTRGLAFRSLDERVTAMTAFHFGGEIDAALEEAGEVEAQYGPLDARGYLSFLPFLTPELRVLVEEVFPLCGLTG